jgi:eukaryotic-like serine/threonine-protein kinase
VDQLFHAALEARGNRTAWLTQACEGDTAVMAEVLSLLGSDLEAGDGFIEQQLEPAVASLMRADRPVRAGPYRLIQELGQGGMGSVYLGERDDDQYKTQVAIKLVRRGLDTDLILHRFYRERQTLARLQHPNIARLLDGGTTPEGLPYIVMEFVEGARITEYCRQRALNVAQKLGLFLDVCKAVEYAHRQFVVHRDLKPGNILVDKSGDVKLLDFGICKLLQSEAQFGDDTIIDGPPPLTPDYASPEQIRGDGITVASDVYSAAAVLYELLTGTKPHRIENYTVQGIEQAICETEVVRPSAAALDRATGRQMEGDLDVILLRALQKDPNRRYATVEEFADDIRRHLNHEPVRARPDSLAYRTRKFLRRRRGLVTAAAAIVLAVSAGVISTMRSARIANENLRLVRQLSNTFVFDVYDAVRELPGSTNARHLIVKTGLQYLDNLSQKTFGDSELQWELATAYRRVGEVQGNVLSANLGNTTGALASYEKALMLLESVLRENPVHRASVMERTTVYLRSGAVRSYMADPSKALTDYAQARSGLESYLARVPNDEEAVMQLAFVHNAAGLVQRGLREFEAARENYSRARELLLRYEGVRPADLNLQRALSQSDSGLAYCDTQLGRLQQGFEGYRQAAHRMERLLESDPGSTSLQRDLMFLYAHMGDVLGNPNLRNLGDSARAVEAYGRMVEVARKLHEADPADQRSRSDYGIALARVGAVIPQAKSGERVRVFEQSIGLLEAVTRANPENVRDRMEMAAVHNFLGDALRSEGEYERAARVYRDGLNIAEPLLPHASGTLVSATSLMYQKLGDLLARRGQRDESLALAQKAVQLSQPGGPAKPQPPGVQRVLTARGYGAMGTTYAALARSEVGRPGDRLEARTWITKSLEAYRELMSQPGSWEGHRASVRALEGLLETMK